MDGIYLDQKKNLLITQNFNKKNGINKTVNILLKRKNTLIRVKVRPTDITNLQSN